MIIYVKQNLEDPVSYEMSTIPEDMTHFDAIYENISSGPLDWWSKIDWKAEFLMRFTFKPPID